MMGRKTTEQFICEAREVHGEKYGYDESVYIDARTKIKITCHEHGVFEKLSNQFFYGQGCPTCARKYRIIPLRITTEKFIKEALLIHGDSYDYSESIYTGSKKPIKIYCNTHKEFFWQSYWNHLHKKGCPVCGREKCDKSRMLGKEKFVKKAIKKYGNRFDYSQVIYLGYETKIEIICDIHALFKQTPASHLRSNHGCPKCGKKQLSIKQKEIARVKSIETNKISVKKCTVCGKEKTVKNFSHGRRQCKDCKKLKQIQFTKSRKKVIHESGSKICTKCNEYKSIKDFGINRTTIDGYHYWCKECVDKYKILKRKKIKAPISDSKKCSKCNENKLLNDFTSDINSKDGLCSSCKACRRKKRLKYLSKEKTPPKNGKKKCSKCNKVKNIVDFHKHNHSPDGFSPICKKCIKSYGSKNKEERNKKLKERRENDPNYKLKGNLRHRINQALKGHCKSKKTMDLIGCTIDELWIHLESQFKNGMSRDNYGKNGWSVDHDRPCASFDLSDPKQQKECFHYKNLKPMWAKDNMSKSSTWNGVNYRKNSLNSYLT